ncbi:hypothetical protein [Candidatus Laterigemmans baculatus]|uniref:hypothetical protein n=1 Tax=Candidatus Laterigemmans baculatus TaxID=2770505 RepID=UPI0013DBCD7F|nr:hypothetical protein [Candidatus Laterigemmans baculatus]
MIGRVGRAIVALCWIASTCGITGAAVAVAAAVPQAADAEGASEAAEQPVSERSTDSERPFSPLHDFLGIDPESGEFVDRPSGSRTDPTSTEPTSTGEEVESKEERDATSRADSSPTRSSDPVAEAEAATEAVRRFTERLGGGSLEEGSLSELSSLFGERLGEDRLSGLTRRLAWLTAGLLSLYPLSILLGELFGAWFRQDAAELTDLDRQYRRTRLLRRLLLSACWIALIILGTIASLNSYWWGQPRSFTLFCVAAAVLGIAIATLTSMIKEAAKHYSLTLLRQMRREQLEIRTDLDELCKRMRQVTMSRD